MKRVIVLLIGIVCGASAQSLSWPQPLRDPFLQQADSPQAITTAIIPLSFVDPKKIQALLSDAKNNLLSAQGILVVEEDQRRILIQDTVARVAKIKNILAALDQPQQQLLLKARIVSVDDAYVRDLGVLFESSQKQVSSRALASAVSTVGSFVMPIANLGNGQLLDVRINALEKTGHARMMSAPEITTLNHQQAIIEAGDEVPYQQEAAYGGTNVAFKKAVLKLQVTPHVLPRQHILLELHVNQDKVSALTVQGVPAIHTQQLATKIELKNKQTFVLGGIYETSRSDQVQGVPFLKTLPVLGYLFRTHHNIDDKREMLVFMTVDIL